MRAATELGIGYPTETVRGDDFEMASLAYALNVIRRDFSPDESAQYRADVEAWQP